MTSDTANTEHRVTPNRLLRWTLAVAGVACVGLGGAGVFIPGLPTTVFLIVAAACFTRSCPWLERKLIHNRFFEPFHAYIYQTRPMPLRAKIIAISMMWVFVGFAVVLFATRDTAPAWLGVPVALAACVGTIAITRWDAGVRRKMRAQLVASR